MGFGKLERKYRSDSALRRLVDFDCRGLALFDSLAALYCQAQRHPKQLFEDQTLMCGTSQVLIIVEGHIVLWKVRMAQRVRAANQFAARAQVGGQSLFDRPIGNTIQDLVNDLAQALGAKVPELSIDRHSPAHMDGGQSRISFNLAVFVVGAGNQLQLVRLVQSQRIGSALLVPLPLAKRDEARAGNQTFCVVGDDLLGARTGDEPPDYDRAAGALLIDSTDFEFIQPLFERAAIAHLITAGDTHSEIERCLHAVIQMANLNHAGSILVTRREIPEQVRDLDVVNLFSRRDFRERERQFARALCAKAWNTAGR